MRSLKRNQILLAIVGVALAVCPLFAVASGRSAVQAACTLKTQGYTGGCSNVNVLFFTQTPQSSIQEFRINSFAGQFTAPNTARSFSIPTGCGSGGQVQITEVRTNGTTCSASYSGNLPHNRPCDQCGNIGGRVSTVSAANYRSNLAANSIGSIFGDSDFTTQTAGASSLPLPTELAGVRVLIGANPAGLFFVSPKQINFLVPSLPNGLHSLQVVTPDGRTVFGDVLVTSNAPGIFTTDNTGSGFAAAAYLPAGNLVYVVLFGTGLNNGQVTLRLNGREYPASYAGGAPGFVGLQQINVPVPVSEFPASSAVGALVTVRNAEGFWDSQGFNLRRQ